MSTTADSWGRVKEILDQVLDAPVESRDALLDSLCGDEPAIRARVERYLALEDDAEDFLEAPAYALPPTERRETLEPGDRVGPYEVVELLGRGGMGAVYAAERREGYEQSVALKVVKRGLDTDEMLRRFHNERQTLARLDHPYIARLIDGGATDDGRPFLVMERIDGEPIDAWCDRRRLGLGERIDLFLKVCEAVKTAHRNLIVHRDLKPDNILVQDDGTPKLLDFGIAKLLQDDGAMRTVRTRLGQRPLTLRWASPEQVAGEAITTQSDVYSLGLLLFQLLTGRSPHGAPTASDEEITRTIQHDEPTRPSDAVAREAPPSVLETPVRDPSVDAPSRPLGRHEIADARGHDIASLRRRLRGDLDAIVLKSLEKDLDRRYGSVDELVADIRRHLEGLPILARPSTWLDRTVRYVRRNALQVAAAAVFFAVVVGWGLTAELQRRAVAEERDKAEAASDLLSELFLETDPDRGGRETTERNILDKGRELLETDRWKERDELRARLLVTFGRIYQRFDEPTIASEMLLEAVEIFDALDVEDPLLLPLAQRHLATALADLDRYEEAERLIDSAVASIRQTATEDEESQKTLAYALREQAWHRHRRSRSAEAEAILAEALEILSRYLDPTDERILSLRRNRSRDLRALGRLDEGAQEAVEVLELRLQNFGDEPRTAVATSWSDVGIDRFRDGDLDGAEEAFREALELRYILFGPDNRDTARTQNNLARVLFRQGRLEEALVLQRAAFEVYEPRRDSGFEGVVTKNLAAIYERLGRCDEALPLIRASQPMLETLEIGAGPIHQADALSVLGACLWATGERGEGAEAMRRAAREFARLEESGTATAEAREARGRLERLRSSETPRTASS